MKEPQQARKSKRHRANADRSRRKRTTSGTGPRQPENNKPQAQNGQQIKEGEPENMKTLAEIKKDLERTRNAIEKKTAEIMTLDYTAERREASQENRREEWKKLYQASKANAERIAKLSGEIYTLEIEARIIAENAKAALFNEAYPIIAAACKKYAGKPYGEKTRAAIWEEVKKAGYTFYFTGWTNTTYKIIITELRDGYTYPGSISAEGHANDADGKTAEFITNDNKVNLENVTARSTATYCENTKKAARDIAKAIHKYEEATKAIEKQRRELINILPEGITEPEYIKEYYIRF